MPYSMTVEIIEPKRKIHYLTCLYDKKLMVGIELLLQYIREHLRTASLFYFAHMIHAPNLHLNSIAKYGKQVAQLVRQALHSNQSKSANPSLLTRG